MVVIQCTQRESEVLVLLAHGHSNKTIASRLGISPHTVRDHIGSLTQRHGLANRVQLASFASTRAWRITGVAQHFRLTQVSPPPLDELQGAMDAPALQLCLMENPPLHL